jgi:hypothetical protein
LVFAADGNTELTLADKNEPKSLRTDPSVCAEK